MVEKLFVAFSDRNSRFCVMFFEGLFKNVALKVLLIGRIDYTLNPSYFIPLKQTNRRLGNSSTGKALALKP